MRTNFFNVAAIYRGDVPLSALYYGNNCKWRLRDGRLATSPSVAHLSITSRLNMVANITQSMPYSVIIDWGDSTAPDIIGPLSAQVPHTYGVAGDYDVTFYVYDDAVWSPGAELSDGSQLRHYGLFSGLTSMKGNSCPEVQSFQFGDNTQLSTPYAFSYMTSLKSIDIPYGTTTLPSGTFVNCTSLIDVGNMDAIISIGDHAFDGCTSYAPLRLPSGLTTIGSYAFNGCVDLPKYMEIKATEIGAGAFQSCTQIDRVWLRNTVQILHVDTEQQDGTITQYTGPFYACTNMTIYADTDITPAGWEEHFNVCRGTSQTILVLYYMYEKPRVTLNTIWNADTRVLTFEDDDPENSDGYFYDESNESLIVF